jgi:hypothetical protein
MLRKTPQPVPPWPFSEDDFLRARGERASATARDLVEMTQFIIAHIAGNRDRDRRRRE